jgi:hypothetical protein
MGECVVIAILAVVAGFWIGFFLGSWDMEAALQRELVMDGHAEYYIDEKTHKRKWRMKK